MAKNKKGKSGPPSIHKPSAPPRHEDAYQNAVYAYERLMARAAAQEESRHPKEIVYTILDERGVPRV